MTDRPPPGRRVPRRNSSTGVGGWAPWRPVQGRILGRPPGRFRQPWRDRRLERPWPYFFRRARSRNHSGFPHGHYGYPSQGYIAPPKKSFGEAPLWRSGFWWALLKSGLWWALRRSHDGTPIEYILYNWSCTEYRADNNNDSIKGLHRVITV